MDLGHLDSPKDFVGYQVFMFFEVSGALWKFAGPLHSQGFNENHQNMEIGNSFYLLFCPLGWLGGHKMVGEGTYLWCPVPWTTEYVRYAIQGTSGIQDQWGCLETERQGMTKDGCLNVIWWDWFGCVYVFLIMTNIPIYLEHNPVPVQSLTNEEMEVLRG